MSLLCAVENPYDKETPKRTCEREWGHIGPHMHKTVESAHGWPAGVAVPFKRRIADEVLKRYPHYQALFPSAGALEGLVSDIMSVLSEVKKR